MKNHTDKLKIFNGKFGKLSPGFDWIIEYKFGKELRCPQTLKIICTSFSTIVTPGWQLIMKLPQSIIKRICSRPPWWTKMDFYNSKGKNHFQLLFINPVCLFIPITFTFSITQFNVRYNVKRIALEEIHRAKNMPTSRNIEIMFCLCSFNVL